MEETRSSILLMRLARTLRKETGNKRYRARIEDERLSLSKLIWISCTRPVRAYFLFFYESGCLHFLKDLLLTELVVISFSVSICIAVYSHSGGGSSKS